MKRIAIIPARGGSKRVKGKNILKIQGKPLLAYSIDQAKECGKFDEIYVNSDDSGILDCAKAYHATPYLRPSELAVDTAKVIDVIKEQIVSLSLSDNVEIAILLPTCPLRTAEDIENAYHLFIENERAHPVVSMTEYEKAPEQAFFVNSEGVLQLKYPKGYSSRSQDHGPSYRYNTAIIITTAGLFMKQSDIVGSDSIPYIMPYERSIDIDYGYHVQLVDLILGNCSRTEVANG